MMKNSKKKKKKINKTRFVLAKFHAFCALLLGLLIISLRFLCIVFVKFKYKALTMTNDNLKTLNDYAKGQLGVLKVALQTQDETLIKYQLGKLKVASELSELCSLVEKGANAQALAMIDDLLAFKASEKCEVDDECFARLVGWVYGNKIPPFRFFPRERKSLTTLKELNLKSCHLKSLSDELANLQSLEKLFLYENKFQEVPKALCELKNLTVLHLCEWGLEDLSNEFTNLQSLEELLLISDNLQEVPKALYELKSLKELTFQGSSDFKSLPNEFVNLQSLEKLNLGGNNFYEFSKVVDILAKLKNLKELDLSELYLEYLPDEFANLQSLERLNLWNNQFYEFPKIVNMLARLKNLKELNLERCGLISLPDEFVNLQSLERLGLYGNEFYEFPKVINKLKNLKECCIDEPNGLKTFTTWID